MKLKHNKKRNTAFLYEALIRALAKSVIENDAKKRSTIKRIIKEHFNKNTILYKELEIYRAITDQKSLDYHLAEKLIFEAKRTYSNLDRNEIFRQQSSLIKSINKNLSKDFYQVFVPNYKSLASIYQILQDQLPLKSKMILEEGFVRKIATNKPKQQEEIVPISNIVYKTFVKKFNNQYSGALLQEQTYLLNKYITSFSDGGIEFKLYLNEEVSRLKGLVSTMLESKKIADDELAKNKIERLLEVMAGFNDRDVDTNMIEQILKIQKLVKEF